MKRQEPGRFHAVFGLDLRSLALCRFLFAIVMIGDLIARSADLFAHYCDGGALPRVVVMSYFWNTNWISLHMMNGTARWQGFLFLVHGLAASCMAVGFYTKTATFVSWFLLTSLHGRNSLILHGGDVFARVALFWMMFLPIEKVCSVDSALKQDPTHPKRRSIWMFATAASAAFIIQYMCVYRVSAVLKTGKEWTEELSATFYALSLDYFRTWLGELLLPHTQLLQLFTFLVLRWELWGPALLVSPFYSQQLRLIGTLGFISMHLGFGLTMSLGQFAWAAIAIATALLPSLFWDLLMRRLRTNQRMALKIYFVSSSAFSVTLARLLSIVLLPETMFAVSPTKRDPESGEEIEPAHSSTPLLRCVDYYGTSFTGVKALSFILRQSPLLWPLGWLLSFEVVHFDQKSVVSMVFLTIVRLIDAYDWGALFSPVSPASRSASHRYFKISVAACKALLVTICMVTVVSWNMTHMNFGKEFAPSFNARGVAYLSHLDQSWGMFAPRPPSVDYYYVVEGQLDDGRMVEMFNNEGFNDWSIHLWSNTSWQRPSRSKSGLINHRWFKFFENFNNNAQSSFIRLELGKFICREWNKRHAQHDRVYNHKIWVLQEEHLLNGSIVPLPKQVLWNHICYDR